MQQYSLKWLQNVSYDFKPAPGTDVYHQQWGRQSYKCLQPTGYIQSFGNGEFLPMAGRGKPQQSFGVDFVTMELSEKQEKEFTTWSKEQLPRLGELTQELVSSGHKLGVSWDGDNECFIVSVTCKDKDQDNYNLCYTSRSDEWVEALQLALYKWDVVSQRSTWRTKAQRKNWG